MYKTIPIPCVPKSLCGFTAVPYEIYGDESKPMIGLVGESPYVEEVRVGRPFVGRSGQLLRRVLNTDCFSFFIFNSVACMPVDKDGNAYKPTKDMVKKCAINRMVAEYYLPKGSLIVLLGRFAIETFLDSKDAPFGNFYEKNGYVYYTAYHPSWALRGNNKFEKFVEVLRRINIVKPEYYRRM